MLVATQDYLLWQEAQLSSCTLRRFLHASRHFTYTFRHLMFVPTQDHHLWLVARCSSATSQYVLPCHPCFRCYTYTFTSVDYVYSYHLKKYLYLTYLAISIFLSLFTYICYSIHTFPTFHTRFHSIKHFCRCFIYMILKPHILSVSATYYISTISHNHLTCPHTS